MKALVKSVLLAACFTTALSVQAQLLSDFSTATNWGSPTTLIGNTGTITNLNDVGNYYTPLTPTDTQFAYMQYTGTTLSYDTSWTIRVDAKYAAPSTIFTSGSAQFINLGLMVTPGSPPLISLGEPDFDGFMVSSNLFSTASNTYNRGFQTSIISPGLSVDGTEVGYGVINGATATFTAVLLSYDAGSHVLTASFDGNTTNGYDSFALPSQSVNVLSSWGMSTSDTFSLYLFGNSGWDDGGIVATPSIALGQATFDNLSAIPEPSTYAAIAGVLALGLAAGRRRRQQAAVTA